MITEVHARSMHSTRRDLWSQLQDLKGVGPWVIVGDFNGVLRYEEKKGGRLPSIIAMDEFQQALDSCQMKEAQYVGATKFTWCNNRKGRQRIISKVDRAFCNNEWENQFLDWRVRALPRIGSDHSPLFGACILVSKPAHTPFRFNSFWVSHETFFSTVKECWCQPVKGPPLIRIMEKLKN